MKVKVLVYQLSPTLCNTMNCTPPGSFVHGILQARTLEWVAIPFSRGYFWPRDQTQVSCIAGEFFTIWATQKAHCIHWYIHLVYPSIHQQTLRLHKMIFLLSVNVILTDFHMFAPSMYSRNKSYLSYCIIFLIYCWI